jgi:hypothetical protein
MYSYIISRENLKSENFSSIKVVDEATSNPFVHTELLISALRKISS